MERDKNSWLGDKTQKVLEDFKKELMKRLEPVVLDLVGRLRHKEKQEPGSGIAEIEYMLEIGDINQAMYDILLPALEKPDDKFEFKLVEDNKRDKPTKLG
jgi:hypothetical protein